MNGTDTDRFREPFSRSLPIRDAEHAEVDRYLDSLYARVSEERRRAFRPSGRGPRSYEQSLVPYRRKLLALLGCPPPRAVSPRITRIEPVGEASRYSVSRVWVRVAEGLGCYGIFLLPRERPGLLPLVVAIHGGSGCPEAICDLDTRANYRSFGPVAAERGWAVWAPSLLMTVGYGGDPEREKDRYYFDARARLVGTSILAIEVHKIIASTMALALERAEVDPSRISMAGLSYGGLFTLLTAAACPAVRAAVCSAFFGSFTEWFAAGLPQSRAGDRRFQGLLRTFDMAELAAMVCPRPLMIQHGARDEVAPIQGSRREAERAAAYYDRLGIPERFVFSEHPGEHVLEPESILAFLARWG